MNPIDKYTRSIEQELSDLFRNSEPASLYEPCRYVLQAKAKRFRPVLTLLASGLCGGSTESALPAAVAVELIHNFTLVHDDIMDEADSRRGRPSVHVKWDPPTAILSGDLLYTEAFKHLLSYSRMESMNPDVYVRLQQTLLHSIQIVCEGQARDMELERAEHATTAQYLRMIEEKTAALIGASLSMGGIVAGANKERLESLHELGRFMGLAFQIQDDLLDAVADPKKFGKKRGGDILEGKKTYLLLLALEGSNEIQRKELINIMTQERGKPEVEKVIQIYRETRVLELAENQVRSWYQKASDRLMRFEDSVFKDDLVNLLKFLENRDY